MKRTVLIVMALLATAACKADGHVVDEQARGQQPVNAVYMPDTVDEPDVEMNEAIRAPAEATVDGLIAEMRKAERKCPDGAEGIEYLSNPNCQAFERISEALYDNHGICLMRDRLYADCDPNKPYAEKAS